VIISEPIGCLLVHERMIESYIAARDRFLKPGGLMMPTMGSIVLAPFADPTLYSDQVALNSPSPASRFLFSASMCAHTSSASQSRCMCAANNYTPRTPCTTYAKLAWQGGLLGQC
jgi:hypothetical protein